jgi:hypothetical protein
VADRIKGFAPWNPQAPTRALLEDIDQVLDEYEDYLPLTVRQVFYRLVGKGYTKSEAFYESIQQKCVRARRSGRIPFAAIRDDGVSEAGGDDYGYDSPQAYYEDYEELYNAYSRSWHDDQPAFVKVLCEAAGMVPMIERAVDDYRVPVASCGGFDSLTAKHDLFTDALRRYQDHGQHTILLHLGDHDPSGWWMHKSMAEDLAAFARDHRDAPADLIELRRTALTPDQIRELDVTTQIGAIKDEGHGKAFLAEGLAPAAQLEALPPNELTALTRLAVQSALDLDQLRASQERERAEYAQVQAKLDEVNAVLRRAFG